MSTDQVYALKIFQLALGGLPFELAADWMRETTRDYGVLNESAGIANRSVFVLQGDHQLVYQNTEFGAGNMNHYEAVFKTLEDIQGPHQ